MKFETTTAGTRSHAKRVEKKEKSQILNESLRYLEVMWRFIKNLSKFEITTVESLKLNW